MPFARNTSQAHQPGGVFTIDLDSVTAESMPHFSHTIHAIVISVNVAKVYEHSSVTKSAGT